MLTWGAADRMHLRLVFLGEMADALVPSIVDAVNRDIARAPFDAVFAGVGVFPPESARKPPRVLWLGVTDGADAAIAVQREIAARLRRGGRAGDGHQAPPPHTAARRGPS